MYIGKKDAAFYLFEDIALATICGINGKAWIGEARAKELMQAVSDAYKMKCPSYKVSRKDSGFCYYRPSEHAIYFNVYWGLTEPVTLHELCHAIHRDKGNRGHRHGSDYVRIWMDVFARYYNIDVKEFEKLADSRGLEYSEGAQIVSGFKPRYG